LPRRALPKIWGTPQTEPWFKNPNHEKIGEVWFESPPATPLLIKFLFTSESLSIQVHPDDAYASAHHKSYGKTEMWHILRAEPGAKIAVGPRHEITHEELARAAGKEEILHLLQWVEAKPGDTWFIPAGTIHALGGGLALCEIQQLSDITYRLYDYGRDRELHIEHSLNVSRLTPCEGKRDPVPIETGRELLAQCQYFRTDRLPVSGAALCKPGHICVVLEGEGRMGQEPFGPGDAFAISEQATRVESSRAVLVSISSQCESSETIK
jgi:mannose-6-phosphate isomerase